MSARPAVLICRSCDGTKRAYEYLCNGCWWTLQPAARAALNRRDDSAFARLAELHRQLQDDTPLNRIEIPR